MSADVLVVAGSAIGSAISIMAVLSWLWIRFRRLVNLAEDLLGEAARPGVPARPGVMERLAAHDQSLAGIHRQLQQLQGQIGTLIGRGILPGPTPGDVPYDD